MSTENKLGPYRLYNVAYLIERSPLARIPEPFLRQAVRNFLVMFECFLYAYAFRANLIARYAHDRCNIIVGL
jgi:hypothetical protein